MKNVHGSKNITVGILCASAAVLIWGITFVSTKYLLDSFSSFEILFTRFIAAYAGLWIMNPKKLSLQNKKDELLFMAAGLSGVTVYQYLENVAISYTSASNVSIIVSICPFFTAIIAQLILKEKHLNLLFTAGFLIAIAGVALVSFNGAVEFHLSPKGDFLALIAAVCWGFYSLFVSKINMLGFDTILVTRRMFFWAVVFMIPIGVFGLIKGEPSSAAYVNIEPAVNLMRWKNILNWINILFLGVGASAFAFASWNIACKNLGTVRATVGIYLIPVITIIVAFFALGERISLMGGIGAVLTIAGLVISECRADNK